MAKGLDDSDRAYNDRKGGQKTKQKNAQLCFAQKTLRLTTTIRRIWALRLKWLKNSFKKYLKKILLLDKSMAGINQDQPRCRHHQVPAAISYKLHHSDHTVPDPHPH